MLLNSNSPDSVASLPRTVGIIQARMGSSRLPGKVLHQIAGKPMLWHVVNRVRHAKQLNHVLVATSTATSDTIVADFCRWHNIDCFRGSENDVLDRYLQAARYARRRSGCSPDRRLPLARSERDRCRNRRLSHRELRLCFQCRPAHLPGRTGHGSVSRIRAGTRMVGSIQTLGTRTRHALPARFRQRLSTAAVC